MFENIKTDNLKKFAQWAVEEYGDEKTTKEAEAIISWLKQYYEKKKIIGPNVEPTFFDLMQVTCYLHNLFLTEKWTSVFIAREKLQEAALKDFKISWENTQHIFSMIEAQLGTDMPVIACHVKPGTPQDDFVIACWATKEYKQ